MAVTLVQAKANGGVGVTTVAITLGATPTTGNFLIAFCSDVSSPGTASLNGANWTQFASSPIDMGSNIRTSVFWKPADSTTSYTFTSTDNGNLGLIVAEVSGLAETFMIDAGFIEGEMAVSGTSCPYGTISPDETESITFLVCATQGLPGGGTGHTFPGTFTILDTNTNRRFNGAYKIGGPASYSGNITWTTSATTAQTLMLSLAPSSATGTVATTLDNFTMSASGGHGPSGTVAQTLDAFTMSASGGHGPDGSAAITLDAFTMDAAGGHGPDGSAALTLDDFTMSATGQTGPDPSGTVDVTLEDFTMAATGEFPYTGTVAVTLDDFTMAASGSQMYGTADITLDDFTMAADGAVTFIGTAAITLDDFTMAATGSQPPYGLFTSTLADFTMAASGETSDNVYLLSDVLRGTIIVTPVENYIVTRRPSGRFSSILDDFIMEASGAHAIAGTADITLEDFTMAGAGVVDYAGPFAVTLDDFTMDASGTASFIGTVSVTLEDYSMAASGTALVDGTVAATLDDFTMSAAGNHTVDGTVAVTLEDFTMAAAGGHGPSGTFATTLANFTMSATGSHTNTSSGDGLSLLGQIGEYAWSPTDSTLMPPSANPAFSSISQVELIAYFSPSDWQGYYGPFNQGTQQTVFGIWDGSINERCFNMAFNLNGIAHNLSRDGTSISSRVFSHVFPADGVGLWVKINWTNVGGVRRVYVRAAQDNVPTNAEWGSPIGTDSGILDGLTLNMSSANLVVGGTDAGAKSPFGGLVKYAELRYQIDGPAVWKCDFRTYPNNTSSFVDIVGGRTITRVLGDTAADVGMPNGQAANVGPTANYKGHVGIAFSALDPQIDTYVITDAIATTKPTTVTADGVTRYVFEKLNVFVAVRNSATVPILIKNSRMGMFFDNANGDTRIEWCLMSRAFLRTGDRTPTATLIDNLTFNTATNSYVDGTTSCLAWATSWGSAPHVISVNAGKFIDCCFQISGKVYIYRCNAMGQIDGMVTAGTGGTWGTPDVWCVETWFHDHMWRPHDANRNSAANVAARTSNSHMDTVKVNLGKGARFINVRDDQWPLMPEDYASLSGPAFLGPHWGKNPNNANWPCIRQDVPGQKYIGTGFYNASQANGNAKNCLISGCIFSAPMSRFVYLLDAPDGKAVYNFTMRRTQFLSGVTEAGPTFTQPRSGLYSFSGAMTATGFAAVWNMPLSGPDVNYGPDGTAYTTFWRTGMVNSSAFVEI